MDDIEDEIVREKLKIRQVGDVMDETFEEFTKY